MKENEFVLLADDDKDRLELMLEAVKDFVLIRDSKPRIVDNTDGHLKYTSKYCAVADKHFAYYKTTIKDIHTVAEEFMKGYDKGLTSGIVRKLNRKTFPETHQKGIMGVERHFGVGVYDCDIGVQIASDGRIWICIDGVAFLRFCPHKKRGA